MPLDDESIDVVLSDDEVVQLELIANGGDNLVELVERAGLSARELATLISGPSIDERRRITTILSGISADNNAREWRFVRENLKRAADGIVNATKLANKLIDDALMAGPVDRLDALLVDVSRFLGAQRSPFLGWAWMRTARLANAPRAELDYMATVLDAAIADTRSLDARITLLRNAILDVPTTRIVLEAKQFEETVLGELITVLKNVGPSNDVVVADPQAMVGYGVFFGESLSVWLPTDESAPGAIPEVESVMRWMQGRHDANVNIPRYLNLYNRLGYLLRSVKWEAKTREPTTTDADGRAAPNRRPEIPVR